MTEIIKNSFCDKVFKTIIRDNVALAEAPINGKNIYEYSKNSMDSGIICHWLVINKSTPARMKCLVVEK